jgi:hypothetical protein
MDKQEKKTIKYLSYKLKKFRLDLTDFSDLVSIQDDKDSEIYDMILDELQDISRCLDIMIDEEDKGQ